MTARTAAPVTAATVRAYFNDPVKGAARLAALPEDARKSVLPGARGRLSAPAVKAFNAKRRAERRYALGATSAAVTKAKSDAAAQRAAAAAAGITVGSRGPLPKAAKVALGQTKG